jgi:two-component sensor histidine kinase
LIASELISNSLKHAFPRGGKGTITLELSQTDETGCLFRISDDGIGLPADFSLDQPSSLGLRLVKMLTEQLHGDLDWSPTPCTNFTLVFQTRPKSRRPKYEPAYS